MLPLSNGDLLWDCSESAIDSSSDRALQCPVLMVLGAQTGVWDTPSVPMPLFGSPGYRQEFRKSILWSSLLDSSSNRTIDARPRASLMNPFTGKPQVFFHAALGASCGKSSCFEIRKCGSAASFHLTNLLFLTLFPNRRSVP